MTKRGQLTVYIIIGIILLLAAGSVIYFTQQRAKAPLEKTVAVPEDLKQVYDYVTSCMSQIGKDGIVLMGAQGGYITLPPKIDQIPTANIPNDPLGISKTPYWFFEGEDRAPSLDFMRRELELFVREELDDCINFASFEPQYTITPLDPAVPIVTFAEEDVVLELKWTLEVVAPDKTMQLEEFIVSFPVKLKQMWELANKVMLAENEQEWFEDLTIDLMSANANIPMSGMEFTCGPKKWHISKVQEELKQTLTYSLPLIRVENTNYPPPLASLRTYKNLKDDAEDIRRDLEKGKEPDWPEEPPADVFQMNSMLFDVKAVQSDLKAAFELGHYVHVNADPNTGGVLSSAKMKGASKYLRFFCINQWHFAYDVIYPVKFSVKDETAFVDEGFIFQMAFPVIVEDNQGSRGFFGQRAFQSPAVDTDFCFVKGENVLDVRAIGFSEGALFAEELSDANITYQCLNQHCNLGQTRGDSSGIIRLQTYLPEACSNPLIVAEKEGYLPAQAHAKEEFMELMLTRLKKLNYTIMVHPYYDTQGIWLENQIYSDFSPDQHATVSISVRNQTFDQIRSYPASASAVIGDRERLESFELSEVENLEVDQIELVYDTAVYDIDILIFKGERVVGGYHASGLQIPYSDIANAEEVTFHAVDWRGAMNDDFDPTNMFIFCMIQEKKEVCLTIRL